MTMATRHWTERSVDDFVFRISSDFVMQLGKRMEQKDLNQTKLAALWGLTVGRVSQVFNSPGNLTLRRVVQYARPLGMKVAVVAYDDGDPNNQNGPINSEIFSTCWQNAGSPKDYFALSALPWHVENPTSFRYAYIVGRCRTHEQSNRESKQLNLTTGMETAETHGATVTI